MLLFSLLTELRQEWPAIVCIFTIVTFMAHIIYNLFFHPLAKVPGPFLAKISLIPSFYHACLGDRHIWIWQLFQIYGKKIRCTPNSVLWNSPQAYNDIYSSKANVQRSKWYTAWIRNEHDMNTLTTVDFTLHAKKRKLLNLIFTEKSVRAAGVFVAKHVDRWNQLLVDKKDDEEWSDSTNFIDCTDHLVFDILGDLCFGKSFEMKEPGVNPTRVMPHAIVKYLKFMYPITRSPGLGLLLWLKPRGLDKLLEMVTPPEVASYDNFVKDSVSERLKLQEIQRAKPEAEQRHDMFHFLCEARNPDTNEPAYKDLELLAEARLLIVAGSDTTSVSLCGIFFYLTRNLYAYSKVVHETRSTFESAEDIVSGPKLMSCQYLRACIDESIRMTPPATSELEREVRPGGTTVEGEFIPAGVNIGCANWATSRNEDVYLDPNIFRPERWIVNEETGVTEEYVARCRENFHPFGQGPGNCAGKNLALLELMLTVGRTLHRLDVRMTPGSTAGQGGPELGWGRRDRRQYQVRDAFAAIRDGPEVQFRKRQD